MNSASVQFRFIEQSYTKTQKMSCAEFDIIRWNKEKGFYKATSSKLIGFFNKYFL
jgi:hypothetical protein